MYSFIILKLKCLSLSVKRNYLLFYRKHLKRGGQSSQGSQPQEPGRSRKQSGGGARRGWSWRDQDGPGKTSIPIWLLPNSSHQIKYPPSGKICLSHPHDVCRQSKGNDLVFHQKRTFLDLPNSEVGKKIFLAFFFFFLSLKDVVA